MKRELGLTLTLAAAAVMTAGMLGGCGQTDGVVAFRGPVEGQRLVAADEL